MSSLLAVYLHGFRSSPKSSKAVMTGEALEALSSNTNPIEWYCPQLLASPRASMEMVMSILRSQKQMKSLSLDLLLVVSMPIFLLRNMDARRLL